MIASGQFKRRFASSSCSALLLGRWVFQFLLTSRMRASLPSSTRESSDFVCGYSPVLAKWSACKIALGRVLNDCSVAVEVVCAKGIQQYNEVYVALVMRLASGAASLQANEGESFAEFGLEVFCHGFGPCECVHCSPLRMGVCLCDAKTFFRRVFECFRAVLCRRAHGSAQTFCPV